MHCLSNNDEKAQEVLNTLLRLCVLYPEARAIDILNMAKEALKSKESIL